MMLEQQRINNLMHLVEGCRMLHEEELDRGPKQVQESLYRATQTTTPADQVGD